MVLVLVLGFLLLTSLILNLWDLFVGLCKTPRTFDLSVWQNVVLGENLVSRV